MLTIEDMDEMSDYYESEAKQQRLEAAEKKGYPDASEYGENHNQKKDEQNG